MSTIRDSIYYRFLVRKKETNTYLFNKNFSFGTKDEEDFRIRRKKTPDWMDQHRYDLSFSQQFGDWEWIELSDDEVEEYGSGRLDTSYQLGLYCFTSKRAAYEVLRYDLHLSMDELRDIECESWFGYVEPLISQKKNH